jgi:MarR family transcriptional regulator, negative regulator of the multidrug operon emrRAB
LTERLTNLLAVVALEVDDRVRSRVHDAAGLGSAGPAALVALEEFANGASIERLRDVIGLTHSGCVRLVDRLAAAGLVERRAGSDVRAVSVVLTRTGHATARRVLAARARAVEPLLAELDADDRRQLEDLCGRLVRSATRQRLAARAQHAPPEGGWLCRMCDFVACGRDRGLCPAATVATQASAIVDLS